jgi:hypothetical protein
MKNTILGPPQKEIVPVKLGKKKRYLTISAFFLITMFYAATFLSCNKDDKPAPDSELKSFTGLVAVNDSLAVGESTMISAVFEGQGVKFEWEASSGKLQGSGSEVEYIVAFCDIGVNTITCKASAENNSITKSINIVVYVQ